MYKINCKWCGRVFHSTQPNAKYCAKYCGGKARRSRCLDRKKSKNKDKIKLLQSC